MNNVGWNLKIIKKYKITTIDLAKVIRKKYTEPTWNDNTYIVTITAKLRLTKKHYPKTKWRIKELLEGKLRLARLPEKKGPEQRKLSLYTYEKLKKLMHVKTTNWKSYWRQ